MKKRKGALGMSPESAGERATAEGKPRKSAPRLKQMFRNIDRTLRNKYPLQAPRMRACQAKAPGKTGVGPLK